VKRKASEMVGNGAWNFPNRNVGDRGRKESIVFATRPLKTNKGWRWLVHVRRVSTIEAQEIGGIFGLIFDFLGFGSDTDVEVIRYELLEEKAP
jgi:hypothetical protein